jgi:hypothetical protein
MSAAEDLMAKFTGAQKGGGFNIAGDEGPDGPEYPYPSKEAAAAAAGQPGGRRRKSHSGRKGHKSNSWLAHVKATMKLHPGKSFKQVLKIAKKTYKRSQSQSQSQSGGRKRKGSKGQSQKKYQNGGSGGKMAGLGESAAPYV